MRFSKTFLIGSVTLLALANSGSNIPVMAKPSTKAAPAPKPFSPKEKAEGAKYNTEILKEFGAPVSNGIVIFSPDEIKKKIVKLNSKEFVLKAQIHAGGRGKAGGVKLIKNIF